MLASRKKRGTVPLPFSIVINPIYTVLFLFFLFSELKRGEFEKTARCIAWLRNVSSTSCFGQQLGHFSNFAWMFSGVEIPSNISSRSSQCDRSIWEPDFAINMRVYLFNLIPFQGNYKQIDMHISAYLFYHDQDRVAFYKLGTVYV